MAESEDIMLSVVVVSYNQDKFLEETIKSVLDQEVDFEIEVIITDDASTDQSISIAESFQLASSSSVTLLKSSQNEGPYLNGLKGFKASSGKYFTWLDGDDSWVNRQKLQTQIDFLEAHEDYVGCFHDAKIIHESGSKHSVNRAQGDQRLYSQFNEYREDFYPWHLLKRNIIPTASLVFRNNIDLGNLPINSLGGLSLNWLMQLIIIKRGKFRYFNEPWSIYNDHPLGVSKKNKLNDFKKTNISILNALLEDDYYSGLKRDLYESMAHEYLQLLLSPESTSLTNDEFEELSRKYLESCNNVAKHLTRSNGN